MYLSVKVLAYGITQVLWLMHKICRSAMGWCVYVCVFMHLQSFCCNAKLCQSVVIGEQIR